MSRGSDSIVSEDEVTNRFIRTLLQRGLIWHPLFRELEVRDVLPCCWIYPHSIADQPVRSFYEPEVDQFFAEYLPLVCMLIERGRAAHEVLSVVVRNRRGYVAYRQQLLAAMDAWSASLMPPRTLREQILDRVALLGYTAEHFPQGRSDIDTLLDEYRPLTDEVWARTRPFLLVEMESNLEAEQERIWESDWEMGTDEDKDVVEIPALMGLVDETSDIDSPAVEVHAADAWP